MSVRSSLVFGALALSLCGLAACEGPPGADGVDGEQGADGNDGIDGSDGSDGADGNDGQDGYSALVESELVFEDALGCEQGYAVVTIGVDDGAGGGTPGDGTLQDGEVVSETVTCLAPNLDEDAHLNLEDNCPQVANDNQLDLDFDGVGDACDDSSDPAIMWAISKGSATTESILYSYDLTTGTATEIGPTGHALISLQVNPADGLLYATTRGYPPDTGGGGSSVGGCDACLMTVDTTTGAASLVVQMDIGPTPSLGFLSDGSAYGWTEWDDYFMSIDTSTGETTQLGDGESSWGHHMGVTDDNTVYWMNGSGELWDIDPANGSMALAGDLSETNDSAIWDPEYEEFGLRGDIRGDGAFWVGTEVTYGEFNPGVGVVDMNAADGPTVVAYFAVPDNLYFHVMTFAE